MSSLEVKKYAKDIGNKSRTARGLCSRIFLAIVLAPLLSLGERKEAKRGMFTDFANLAIQHYNHNTGEAYEFRYLGRVNHGMSGGFDIHYVNFIARKSKAGDDEAPDEWFQAEIRSIGGERSIGVSFCRPRPKKDCGGQRKVTDIFAKPPCASEGSCCGRYGNGYGAIAGNWKAPCGTYAEKLLTPGYMDTPSSSNTPHEYYRAGEVPLYKSYPHLFYGHPRYKALNIGFFGTCRNDDNNHDHQGATGGYKLEYDPKKFYPKEFYPKKYHPENDNNDDHQGATGGGGGGYKLEYDPKKFYPKKYHPDKFE